MKQTVEWNVEVHKNSLVDLSTGNEEAYLFWEALWVPNPVRLCSIMTGGYCRTKPQLPDSPPDSRPGSPEQSRPLAFDPSKPILLW